MNADDYRKTTGINWSLLKHMRRSPLAYHHAKTAPPKTAPHFAIGTALHLAVLEPNKFTTEVIGERIDRRTNAGKARAAEVEAEGLLLLSPEDYARVLAMRDAVLGHPAASAILQTASGREVPMWWTDDDTGLPCKGLADILGGGILADLKTTRDASPRGFGRSAAALGYPGQLAHYRAGAEASGEPVEAVYIIAVETEAPHDVAVYLVTDDVLDAADRERRSLLRRVAECEAVGVWPGMAPEVEPLDVPEWSMAAEIIDGEA